NRVAECIGKRTAAPGGQDAGESHSAVGGARYTGEVIAVRALGVIESGTNFVGVIWVSRSERLRLNNVWRGLSAGDQVNIRSPIRERDWQQFLDKVDQAVARGARTTRFLAAGNHDEAGPKTFHPVNAKLVNFRT